MEHTGEQGQSGQITGRDIQALLAEEDDLVAGLANAAAVIMERTDGLNWAGFYLLKGDVLVLGPFQGRPACARIPRGKGVCGRAAETGAPVVVGDVHAFPGHIPCDAASRSEMVVPLFRGGGLFGVLDLDSPRLNRFEGPEVDALIAAGNALSRWLDTLSRPGA